MLKRAQYSWTVQLDSTAELYLQGTPAGFAKVQWALAMAPPVLM